MLQWGRNFCVTERARYGRAAAAAALLQWGRNFCVTESPQGRQLCACQRLGFNGAVTFALRKACDRCKNLNRQCPLQWGRNFCVTESRRYAVSYVFQLPLQWGRNFCVTESAPKDTGDYIKNWLQWGRNFCVTESPHWRFRGIRAVSCFNGAVTFALRKGKTHAEKYARICRASMGP